MHTLLPLYHIMSTRQPKQSFRERCRGLKQRIQVQLGRGSRSQPASSQPPPQLAESSAQESPEAPIHEGQDQNSSHSTQSATRSSETLSFHTPDAEISSIFSFDRMHRSASSVIEDQTGHESGPHDGSSAALTTAFPIDTPSVHRQVPADEVPAPLPRMCLLGSSWSRTLTQMPS